MSSKVCEATQSHTNRDELSNVPDQLYVVPVLESQMKS